MLGESRHQHQQCGIRCSEVETKSSFVSAAFQHFDEGFVCHTLLESIPLCLLWQEAASFVAKG